MGRKGNATRTAIMDAAEALIMEQGFAATSVERVIERAGITKGSFFYHFPSKADLAHAIVERYAENDRRHLEEGLAQAERMSRDPLQQVLIFVGLLREEMLAMGEDGAGCLYASYCYEAELFDGHIMGVVVAAFGRWRERLGAKLAEAMERHPPRLPVDPWALADMLTVIFEGAFVLSRTRRQPEVVAEQLALYRDYLELIFSREDALARS